MPALIPFWLNWSQSALDQLDARWQTKAAQAGLKGAWQIIKIDGVILPGVCKIEKVEQKLSVMTPKKSGGDGGRPLIRGRENPDFVIDVELYAPYQWIEWQLFAPRLNVVEHPTERDEHYVEHPMCAESGINWCICIGKECFAPEPGGGRKIKIKLLGCSEKKGATVVPARGALPTGTAPQINVGVQAPAPNLVDVVPPGPDFGS